MRRFVGLSLTVIATIALLNLVGCTTDPEVLEPRVTADYPFPDTPEGLMANFVKAFEERNLDEYAKVLHEDFIFSYQECDVRRLGLSKSHDGRDEELSTAANMFSGQPRVKDGRVVAPAITAIEFQYFQLVDGWRPAEDSARAGAQRAAYDMLVHMQREDGSRITIRGHSTFYAVADEARKAEGGTGPYHRLIGWVDLTEGCVEQAPAPEAAE